MVESSLGLFFHPAETLPVASVKALSIYLTGTSAATANSTVTVEYGTAAMRRAHKYVEEKKEKKKGKN